MIPANIVAAIAAVKAGNLIPIPTQIGDVVVSALTGLSAPRELDITRKPIEDGYAVTDAAVDVPQTLTLEVCLTNPGFSIGEVSSAAMSGSVSSLLSTWRDKRDYLYQILEDRELVNVLTHEGWYIDMLLHSIDPIFDADENYDCYFATLQMTQIKVVASSLAGLIDSALQNKGKL